MSIRGNIFGVDIAATMGLLLLITASGMVQAQVMTQAHDQAQA
jgi:hypothetical protein